MNDKTDKVITRIAPSPTGNLHIGTARTALFNFIFAKKNEGEFIVRSEDTDKERSKKEFEQDILDGLEWLGITPDHYYKQSERSDIHTEHLKKMIDDGKAYISREKSKQDDSKEVEVVRLKNPNKSITFEDTVRGSITFDTTELGDFVIARSIHDPLYHLAVVIDDHEMNITHVIRGEDHISNTPRQILIQEAIGAKRPIYAHLPLILAEDKSKLSKRHGAISVLEYRSDGYLPDALFNYLALLGWNPGTDEEVFSRKEIIQLFSLEQVQKGGAVFNAEKLNWFNKEHIKKLSRSEQRELLMFWLPEKITALPQYSKERLDRLMPTIFERTSVFNEIHKDAESGEYDYAFDAPDVSLEMLPWKNDGGPQDALPRLEKASEILETFRKEPTAEKIKEVLWPYAEEVGKGELLWPLRVAMTGKEQSPDPFSVIYIIGVEEAKSRLKTVCDRIKSA